MTQHDKQQQHGFLLMASAAAEHNRLLCSGAGAASSLVHRLKRQGTTRQMHGCERGGDCRGE
jgi:hypothetical protein